MNTPKHRRPFPPEQFDNEHSSDAPAPASTRTRFAVTLQLGRAYASLVALVRDSEQNHHGALARHAHHIASIIIGGARDRCRDLHRRPLSDQQSRTESLTSPRAPRKAYPRLGRKGQGPRPALPARVEGRRRSKNLIKKRRGKKQYAAPRSRRKATVKATM